MVACVAHAGKAFLGGTSGCRLSLCSLVHPWWSVAFPGWAVLVTGHCQEGTDEASVPRSQKA